MENIEFFEILFYATELENACFMTQRENSTDGERNSRILCDD